MSEHTLHRPNLDRVVVRREGDGWQVTYYAATRVRGSWLRRLFARPPLFRVQAGSPAQVQAVLIQRNIHLTRAELQRLNSLMNMQQAQERTLGRLARG